MRQATRAAVAAGLASLVLGIISRMGVGPVLGLVPMAFFEFSDTCFLFAIAASLVNKK